VALWCYGSVNEIETDLARELERHGSTEQVVAIGIVRDLILMVQHGGPDAEA
jgi:hypothetical protein